MAVNQLGPTQALGQGDRQDQSGIGHQAMIIKGNLDAVGALLVASIGCSWSGVGFVFLKPLSPKPRALSYPFSTPPHSSLRWIGAKKTIHADTGSHWVANEMTVRVGGRQYWNWNVMDAKTRYVLASRISRRRGLNDARAVFRKALRNAESPPDTITTDGLAAYVEAIKTVFPTAKHIVSEGIYEPVNNNLSERLQGDFRQRTKTLRGLQTLPYTKQTIGQW